MKCAVSVVKFPVLLLFYCFKNHRLRNGKNTLRVFLQRAPLSFAMRCDISRRGSSVSAVSKINTAPTFAFTPKQRPCGAHSNLPTSHNTWFSVCKGQFHWLICSETANPTSCYKRLFQVQTTGEKANFRQYPGVGIDSPGRFIR